MYPQIPWELVMDPLGYVEHTLGTPNLSDPFHSTVKFYPHQSCMFIPSSFLYPINNSNVTQMLDTETLSMINIIKSYQ